MTRIVCPKCGQLQEMPDEFADTIERCSGCGSPEIIKSHIGGRKCTNC